MQDTKYPPLSTIQPKKVTYNIQTYMVLHGIKMNLHNFTQFHYDIYTYMECKS